MTSSTTDTEERPDGPSADSGMTSTRGERVGWYSYSWANHGYITVAGAVFLGPFLVAAAKIAAGCDPGDSCRGHYVHPLGIPVAAGSYFSYLVTLGTLLTVVVLPLVGALADRFGNRKRMLIGFAYLGALSTCGMVFVTGDRYLLGGVLYLLANIGLQAAAMLQNSYVPQLAGAERRDAVSSIGFATGYLGGALLLAASLVALVLHPDDKLTVARWGIFAAGVWWGVFTIVTVLLLKERAAPTGESSLGGRPVAAGSVLTEGFRQLGRTLRLLVRQTPLTLFFLVAFFVYNDGIQTVISQASVYGTYQLKLDQSVLVETILLVQFVAFGGALLLGRLARTFGARKTVLAALALWVVVIVAAFWLPVGKAGPFLALGVLIGIVMGGSQALSRSLFSQLVPRGREAEYFGIYAIGDVGTSWVGTLLFGVVYQATFDYRPAIFSLLVFFVIGFVLLLAVPMRRAILAAGNTPPRLL
jgi:UMF1 family MFS transporter